VSGRARHWRDGKLITNRKTDRRQSKSVPPDQMPDWVLRFLLPTNVAFSVAEGPTNVVGVAVVTPGPYVEVRGKNMEWVLRQAAVYLGVIAGSLELRIAHALLSRDAYPGPTPDAPWRPNAKRSLCLIHVPGPSVIIPRAHDPALIFPVQR
jgi:hypothetical protein